MGTVRGDWRNGAILHADPDRMASSAKTTANASASGVPFGIPTPLKNQKKHTPAPRAAGGGGGQKKGPTRPPAHPPTLSPEDMPCRRQLLTAVLSWKWGLAVYGRTTCKATVLRGCPEHPHPSPGRQGSLRYTWASAVHWPVRSCCGPPAKGRQFTIKPSRCNGRR